MTYKTIDHPGYGEVTLGFTGCAEDPHTTIVLTSKITSGRLRGRPVLALRAWFYLVPNPSCNEVAALLAEANYTLANSEEASAEDVAWVEETVRAFVAEYYVGDALLNRIAGLRRKRSAANLALLAEAEAEAAERGLDLDRVERGHEHAEENPFNRFDASWFHEILAAA